MSDDSSRNLSSRVFHVDRECYVVYVGTTDHRFRPFLRLGTSPWLPDKVKRHISNVVISDHLTGNPQYERQCLERPVSHDMRYVGTKELVNSVKQFVHDQTIASRPISPPKDQEAEREGAHVLFYSDGNVRVVVDGREVLDLSKRERSDRHGVFELRRLNDFARSSTGAYFASSFTQPGFLYSDDGSLFCFGEETLDIRRLAPGGLDNLSRRLIPPDLVHRLSGPVERESFVDLCKWKLREKKDLLVATPDSGAEEIEELITLLSKAGLKVKREHPEDPPEPLSTLTRSITPKEADLRLQDAPEAPRGASLTLPEETSWLGGAEPPLLAGMPYQLPSRSKTRLDQPERETLINLFSDGLKKRLTIPEERPVTAEEVSEIRALLKDASGGTPEEPVTDRLVANLLLWNLITEALWSEPGDSQELTKELQSIAEPLGEAWRNLLYTLPLPVNATLFQKNQTLSVTFSLPPGFTKGRVSENRRVAEKIAAYLERRTENSYYQEERRRLESFLDSLIEKQRVAPVAAPSASKEQEKREEERPKKDESSRGETEATGTTRERPAAASAAGANAAARSAGSRGGTATRGESSGGVGRGLLIAAAAIILLGGAGYLLIVGLGRGEGPPGQGEESVIAEEQAATVAQSDGAESAPGGTEAGEDGEASEPGEDTGASEPGEDGEAGSGAEVASGDRQRAPATDPDEDAGEIAADEGGSGTARSEASEGTPEEEIVVVGNGGFEVTVVDVLLFVNRVARLNGYDPIGSISPDGRDPDWIYPGNRIELPDGTVHTVQRGDTLWGISRDFLLAHVNEHYSQFLTLKEVAESGNAPIERLENLREEVYVESLREAIDDFLESIEA